MTCRLCESTDCSFFISDKKRDYILCNRCKLIFVPEKDLVTISTEKKRYTLHNNTIDNKEYVKYLKEFTREIERIPVSNPKVLDFGSGQEKVLTHILQERGYDCYAYDPLYGIGLELLHEVFDIVILCEVAEHLRDFRKELGLIKKLLSRKGYVILRTELYQDRDTFTKWWYTKDITHINYFSMYTMEKLAKLISKNIFYTNSKNVVILE